MRIRNATHVKQRHKGCVLLPGRWYVVPEEVPPDVAQFLLSQGRATAEYTGDEPEMLYRQEDRLHLRWLSPFSLGDGYGTAAEALVLALDRAGADLAVQQCWFMSREGLNPRLLELLRTSRPEPFRLGLCMATPGEFHKLTTPYRLGFTMYEADDPLAIHPEWKPSCREVDRLLVPSEYCREVFGAFARVPIDVVPLVVNEVYNAPRLRTPGDTFTFVSHGTLTGRKGPLETVALFKRAFPRADYPDVRLVFKTRLEIFGWGERQLPRLDDPRIKILSTGFGIPDWSPEKLRDWLYAADCHLFLSKGEGFGMPPREAMLTGMPVIFSDFTGLHSLANPDVNWPIPVGAVERSPLGGDWRLPDADAAIEAMRWVYHHRESAYERAFQGAQWYNAQFGSTRVAGQMLRLLEGIDATSSRRPGAPEESPTRPFLRAHAPFLAAVQAQVPVEKLLLVVGKGDGVGVRLLAEAGYSLLVLLGEGETAEGLPEGARYLHAPLVELSPGLLSRHGVRDLGGAVSLGVLQGLDDGAARAVLAAMRRVAPVALAAVPSVYYPGRYAPAARLLRAAEWQDRLLPLVARATSYGPEGRYLLLEVALDAPEPERQGRILDGVWRPRL
jgi:glycosyltransferase involved in cell wall biosynthesis